MADGYMTAVMDGLRAALFADVTVAALVADRVVDEPAPAIQFPYVRFGRQGTGENRSKRRKTRR